MPVHNAAMPEASASTAGSPPPPTRSPARRSTRSGAGSTSADISRSAAATSSSSPRSSAPPPTSTPRTTSAPGPAPTATRSRRPRRRLRGPLRQQGRSDSAIYRVCREEGLSVDVASGGELYVALQAGFEPERIHMHGNNKSADELRRALRRRRRHRSSTRSTRSPARRARCSIAPGGADPGDAGDQALDPLLHPDGPARLEVRLRDRGRPAAERPSSAVPALAPPAASSGSTPTSARSSSS